MCGFGIVHPLPGIAPGFELNTAITLPVGVESYGAYALGAWLSGPDERARNFAKWSAVCSLAVGMLGQVAFHLLSAAHATHAPWPVVVLVACLPVAVLGLGAALAHLLRAGADPAEVAEGEAMQAAERESRLSEGVGMSDVSDPSEGLSAPLPQCSSKWLGHPDVQAILLERPGISGAALGEKLGVSKRTGQRILAAIATN
jgi:hypothetical protein